MSNVFFKVDARTLLTLGRESIKDHTTAVVELVKNSYDADATLVEVQLVSTKETDRNFVRVADNGHGMTRDDIEHQWLRIGFSAKRRDRVSQDYSRRRTGEKGIGRLSADRLGRHLELRTFAANSPPVGLIVDWDQFEKEGKELGSVPVSLLADAIPTLPAAAPAQPSASGTELRILGLRQTWTVDDVRVLHNELATLTPPFKGIKIDFRIDLNTDLVSELNGAVTSSFIENAELELSARFSGRGSLNYSIRDRLNRSRKNQRTIKGNIKLPRLFQEMGDADAKKFPRIGPCNVQLMFFPRKSTTLEGTGLSLNDLRQFLDTNAGIRIYRDSIRVKPYGDPTEPEGDWLRLAERKTRSPAGAAREDFRFAPNQLVGAVFVTRDSNPALEDSSSREGLIHSESFSALRKLVLGCVFLLEARYHTLFLQQRTRERGKRKVQRVRERIKGLRDELRQLSVSLERIRDEVPSDSSDDVQLSLERIDAVIEGITDTSKSLDELAGESTIYRGLATLGIASAVFGHETQTSISSLLGSLHTVQRLLAKSPPRVEPALSELAKAHSFAEKVGSWGRFALLRVKRDKRRLQQISVKELVEGVVDELRPVLKASSIEIKTDVHDVHARTFAMDLESALINLIANAYSACQQIKRSREIQVTLKQRRRNGQDGFELAVADSGPGVSRRYAEQIWEPLFSTKVDAKGRALGTGLGLAIVRSTVEELGGAAWHERDKALGGAKFLLWMPASR